MIACIYASIVCKLAIEMQHNWVLEMKWALYGSDTSRKISIFACYISHIFLLQCRLIYAWHDIDSQYSWIYCTFFRPPCHNRNGTYCSLECYLHFGLIDFIFNILFYFFVKRSSAVVCQFMFIYSLAEVIVQFHKF